MFRSIPYSSTVRHGVGLMELGIGLGIVVSRHFIYYHIHLRLGQIEVGIGLMELRPEN